MLETIQIKLISCYYNNFLNGHFGIKKTYELLAQKYYCSTLCHNVKAYLKSFNICLALKAIRHKPYNDL